MALKAVVTVHLKPGVLDPQGRAVAEALHGLGYGEVGETRIGKRIEMDLDTADAVSAKARVEEMAAKLLANPVIESFAVDIV
ncbi:MAG: phosphoribosylformylglycinamidine synthase subunit PurS [Hyphomonadaceae bacterium]|jgi:phosphoribosylformylglycinamidine synthase|nr:phosphoribosylformylglycinamidine synthase subunit PurS [Hyphomonadaceae bacterium]